MESSFHRPTTDSQTIHVIRGMALLGMLIVNSQTYSLVAFLSPSQVYRLGLDRPETYIPIQFFVYLFVKGQSELIFSFLFGFYFYRQWERDKRAGLNADRIAQRKLWVLLGFGIVHGFLFWSGDLLHQYAILGFTLLYFTKQSVSKLGKWILGLVLLVILAQLSLSLFHGFYSLPAGSNEQRIELLSGGLIATWRTGSIWDVMGLQSAALRRLHLLAFKEGLSPYVQHEVMFLSGLIVAKLELPRSISRLKVRFSLLLFLLFPVAFFLKGISVLMALGLLVLPVGVQRFSSLLASLSTFIGTLLLTMVYLLDVGLNHRLSLSSWAKWIGRVGQMGLTNYLLQTLLCMVVFYGYGLGLSGRLTLLESMEVVGGIYAVQIGFSTIWLGFHQLGPLEWLCDQLIYTKGDKPLPVPTTSVETV